jgi:hypothetical protein
MEPLLHKDKTMNRNEDGRCRHGVRVGQNCYGCLVVRADDLAGAVRWLQGYLTEVRDSRYCRFTFLGSSRAPSFHELRALVERAEAEVVLQNTGS